MNIDWKIARHYLCNWLVSWAGLLEGIIGILTLGLKMPFCRLKMCRILMKRKWFKTDWKVV